VYEGKNILIEEFGERYKIYFSIMEAIAKGKTTIGYCKFYTTKAKHNQKYLKIQNHK